MTFVVPFDGSNLSEAALARANEFSTVLDETVLAVAVIPRDNATYAREREWMGSGEEYDIETIITGLHEHVTEIDASANFRHEIVERYAQAGSIAKEIRRIARNEDASLVFIGSENAGRMVTGVSSVGGRVAADDAYDVV
ncbi:MAG: universal stress protein, partial [Halobacteriaceae archaeon]